MNGCKYRVVLDADMHCAVHKVWFDAEGRVGECGDVLTVRKRFVDDLRTELQLQLAAFDDPFVEQRWDGTLVEVRR